MRKATCKIKLAYSICTAFCFYGTNLIAHAVLPKWIDIIVGLPLSIFFMYKIILYYKKTFVE
jgi:hypothetical protein